jgi:hypothetical protein
MILILTTEAGDFSHPKIIDWLNFYKAKYLIITGESLISGNENFTITNNEIFYNNINLTKDIKVLFYRRWINEIHKDITNDRKLNYDLNRNLYSEMYEIRNFLFKNLINAKWFPNANNISINKLTILEEAKLSELNVPNYIVTNSLDTLKKFFFENNEEIVTKAIGNFQRCVINDEFLVNPIYTKIINIEIIQKLSNRFMLSFFQKLIPKKFEYRVLFFNNICYSSAILSQENELTKFDSRINNDKVESKLVPIEINSELNEKIVKLMNKIGLNTGSLDFIQSIDDEVYFLEVNPVGQISGYSERCILDFEKEIVEQLIIIDNG